MAIVSPNPIPPGRIRLCAGYMFLIFDEGIGGTIDFI